MLSALVACVVCLAPPSFAGGGPENLALVVNADSPDSLAVANEYVSLRQVPPSHVIYLSGLDPARTIKSADCRDRILRPVLESIRSRGLEGQIDYLVYSAGFPFAVDVSEDMAGKQFPRLITQPASLTGVTYFEDLVLAGSTEYLAIDANWYARRLTNEKSQAAWPESDQALGAKLHTLLRQYQDARKKAAEANTPLEPEAARLLDEAVGALQILVANHPANPELLYDLACVLALQGKPDDAMTALRAACDSGWWNALLTEADTDLVSLRDRADFKALVEKMRGVIVESQPAQPFSGATVWDRSGAPTTSADGRRFVISAMLAYTGGPANTLDEALQCLRTSCAADGSCPAGTIYYMVSSDRARTGPRQAVFRSAVNALGKLGVQGAVLDGVLPQGKPDVAGAMIGIAGFKWADAGSTILPGAFCDHLTSFGAVMTGAGQTLLSEFIRYGAAGACGTVTEPYAIPGKFPSPFFHVYYASGCSLAEAFYQSVRGPYQQLLVGDPLCRPWAKIPQVQVKGLSSGEALSRVRRLTPTATGADPATRFELYVDGLRTQSCAPGETLTLDPKGLAEGYHEACIVAIAGPVETQGQTIIPFRVGKRDAKTEGWPAALVPSDAVIHLTASLPGAQRIAFLQNSREVAAIEGATGAVDIQAATLGLGPVQLQPVATLGDGRQVLGAPHVVTVGPTG
ncbi:MAG: hypothetical protein FJX75_01425 [Armatimonadetes bacterium]|nr:hypothetical protein [Armatimonadota bacterium]